MMGTPLLCIRNKTFFSQIWRREVRRAEAGEKKSPCIQTGGPAELMGSGRAAFLWGSHLHNVKVFGVGAESSPLVGTVGEVEGREGGGRKERPLSAGGPTPRCCRWEMCAPDTPLRPPPPSPFICKTIYQQSLRQPPGRYAELLRLRPANESCVAFSDFAAIIIKKRRRAFCCRNRYRAKLNSGA